MKKAKFNSVVFDVDSTLTTIEGLDFLAKLKGKGSVLAKITKAAMDGKMTMRKSLETKMAAISPSYSDLIKMGNEYIKNVTLGALETIKILNDNHIQVWILTGNFQPAVGIFADYLKIDSKKVITNQIYFDESKNYLGFDLENPLSNNGGKSTMINAHKKQMGKTALVGDGSTDLEAKSNVDLFIGYGGVAYRQKVKDGADIYISEQNLLSIIPHIISIQIDNLK